MTAPEQPTARGYDKRMCDARALLAQARQTLRCAPVNRGDAATAVLETEQLLARVHALIGGDA